MDANEYLNKVDLNLNDGRVRLSRPQMIAFMESYHYSKSKEEAEKRTEAAIQSLPNIINRWTVDDVKKAICIAAGKEK